MQTCKYCSFEFDDTLSRCPECGTKVRRKAEPQPAPELCLVASAGSMPEAEILCSLLQSDGIAYLTECPDGLSSVFGGIGGQTDIYVAREDEQKALGLLEEFASAEFSEEEQDAWETEEGDGEE
jgi:hypothetical protein